MFERTSNKLMEGNWSQKQPSKIILIEKKYFLKAYLTS